MAAPALQMITANRLRDGEVVWWKDDHWVGTLNEGQVFPDPKAADEALEKANAFVRDNIVVAPYLFDVRIDGSHIHPVKEREIIRAAGPSVRVDTGKQAARSAQNVQV